jgi:hypothetical protein
MKSPFLIVSVVALLQARSAAVAFDLTKGVDLEAFLRLEARAGDKPFADSDDESNWIEGTAFFQGYLAQTYSLIELNIKLPYGLPKEVTVNQIIAVVRKFVAAHRELLPLRSGDLITLALVDEYPNAEFKRTP